MNGPTLFDLSSVFSAVAAAVPDQDMLVWRDRRVTYSEVDRRIDAIAAYLRTTDLGCHTERKDLARHESGQDHLGIYLRNGTEYLEAMIAGYRARVAPFNVSYRYVEDELTFLLADSNARALAYHAEFAPRIAAIRADLPHLRVLIQVADDSGHELLPGAVDYETVIAATQPTASQPGPSGEDLYILYTGGTTGMPKGVLWRQHDIFLAAMGGRPFGSAGPLASYAELADRVRQAAGAVSLLMLPPFIHGAAQWGAFHAITMGGRIVIPDDVRRLDAHEVLRLAERERVLSIPVVGDAMARPLVEALEHRQYDLTSLAAISNGGAPLSPPMRQRIMVALPHVSIIDGVGASESGMQLNASTNNDCQPETATFPPQPDTAVLSAERDRILAPGEGDGWLARRDLIPLGYLGDPDKTEQTFPTVNGTRWSVPGDRARILPDGRIELLGRDSLTINSGGEKIYVEEVERAIAAHPAVSDVIVVGRPSPRWGSEAIAIIALAAETSVADHELINTCRGHIADYKIPKAFIRAPMIIRSPAGKADYRWAAALAAAQA
ncbi:acyl-CoA synthetase [Mycobacterium sp. AZCC_0083]|uniref:acyl-CoA synthetase n=1 Tax=Mycobacterium sp. AZCC_0083 TaxID=2735882 RepID=UPI00161B5FFC|nr:acyl-CoA synthetase [Mycobacterium sp. AZCC_0083]MBB5166431.1 fatty-acyl-CoA synthase [Mycobacterium sp. AZCC_0083]